jgi:TP901 family phage tail tape measure protein
MAKSLVEMRNALQLTKVEESTLIDTTAALHEKMGSAGQAVLDVVGSVGALAQTAGVSESTVAGLAAAFTASGVEGDRATMAIKLMLKTLDAGSAATKQQQQAFSQLGLSATGSAHDLSTNANAALLDLANRLHGLSDGNQEKVLTQLFGRSAAAIAPLVRNTDLLSKALGIAGDAAGNAGAKDREYANAKEDLAAKTQLFENNLTELE